MSPFLHGDDGNEIVQEEREDNLLSVRKNVGQLDIVGLLKQVTETHDLPSVQSIKLKVMTKDLPLHSLHTYLPGLKELDLECSNIHSLRELGSDLRSLQVLRLGRCRIESLDGILAFKHLKEFSAPNNYITDLGLAGQLPNIIYFDISRNYVDHWNQLSFFKDASTLEEILFVGNPGSRCEDYAKQVEELLPQLVILDGVQIDGRVPRRTSPVLRAPDCAEQNSKVRGSSRKLHLNHDLCGNLTAALAHNKKRQRITAENADSKVSVKANKLSDTDAMLNAAEMWKKAYNNFTKKNGNISSSAIERQPEMSCGLNKE